MKLDRKRLWFGLSGVGVLIVLGSSGWWWQAAKVRAAVAAVVPARPGLQGQGPGLGERIEVAERRARSVRTAIAGLAELARLYHANGFLPQAGECERALTGLDRSNPLWPYLLAHTLGGYGDLDAALPLLQRTVELAPDYVPAQIQLADALFKRNENARAAAVYRQVLDRDPTNGYALIGLARTELAAGLPAAAQQRLQRLVAAQPEFVAAWTLLINIDEQLGDQAAAATHRRQAPPTDRSYEMPDPWVDELMMECHDPYRLAVAAAAADPANNQARARQLLERATAIAPEGDLAFRLLGNLLADLGEFAAARRNLERATVNNPKDPDNWSYLVRVLKSMADMPAANRALDAGLAHCPDAPVLHLERGRRLVAAGQLEAAAGAFAYAQQLRPNDSSAPMELARVLFRQDRLEEGVAELRKVVQIDATHPVAVVLLARYAINNGDETAAAEWIDRARRQPKLPVGDLQRVVEEYRARFGRTP